MRRRQYVAIVGAGVVSGCTGDITGTATLGEDEVKDEAESVSHDSLMRSSDEYEGDLIHIDQGKITQVLGDEEEGFQFRIYMTPGEFTWEDDVLVRWGGERYLADDIVAVWGRSNGLVTYETVLGNERTIPDISARVIEMVQSG